MKLNTADGRSDNIVHNDAEGAFERLTVEFPSCGVVLRGVLLLPTSREGRLPAIVMAPGMSGVKEGSIFKYAEFFARGGFVVELSWKDNQLITANISSKTGGPLKVRSSQPFTLQANQQHAGATSQGNAIAIDTEAAQTYEFTSGQ